MATLGARRKSCRYATARPAVAPIVTSSHQSTCLTNVMVWKWGSVLASSDLPSVARVCSGRLQCVASPRTLESENMVLNLGFL